MLQLALNVLLFVPLGFFLRVLGGRGILTSLLVGFGVSLVIETTQLTGVWGLYPCAYRVFDVDDLLTNTLGAVLGSLVALVVPRRLRGGAVPDAAAAPHPVTRGRRVLAMVCDGLGSTLVGGAVGIGVQVVLEYVARDHAAVVDGSIAQTFANVVPPAVWALVVLVTGRTVGDLAVELRYRGGPLPQALARPLRFVGGIGGYLLLGLLPGGWAFTATVFAVASLIATLTTAQGRGLPGLASGQSVTDAREAPGSTQPAVQPAAK